MLEVFNEPYTQLIAFYLDARLFMGVYFVALAYLVKAAMLIYAMLIFILSALWIASVYIMMPLRLVLIWLAISIDLIGPFFFLFLRRGLKHISSTLGAWMERTLEFCPATNIEHKTERTNAFVTLVFGYSVVALVYQSASSFGLNAFFGKSILGLTIAFSFNWLHFEVDGSGVFSHAIRRRFLSCEYSTARFSMADAKGSLAFVWVIIHVPFIMDFIIAGAALSRLVVAHDCADANIKSLTANYEARSEEVISQGLRWFYCAGLGTVLACTGGDSV